MDDFLAGELSASESHQFAAHVGSCAECRVAVDEQRWIDGLLRSPELAAFESPSAALVGDFRSALTKTRQRAGMLVAGLAAAVLLLAAGWLVLRTNEPMTPAGAEIAAGQIDTNDPAKITAAVESLPRAVVDGGADMLVVPVGSPYPNVTVVRVYPAFHVDGDTL